MKRIQIKKDAFNCSLYEKNDHFKIANSFECIFRQREPLKFYFLNNNLQEPSLCEIGSL